MFKILVQFSWVVTSKQDYPNKYLHDARKHISSIATACIVSSEKLQEMNEADEEMLIKSKEVLLSTADLQLCIKELTTALDDFNNSIVKKMTFTDELIDESDQLEQI